MRTRINNITFTPGTRSINTGIIDLTVDDVRLFINESQMKVICSSMLKNNIDSIVSGVVTYKNIFPVLAAGDHITFEIDRGDNVAKEVTSQAILSSLPKFSVENDDTLVIYTDNEETEKRIPVMSTGVYRMKWSEDIAGALDLEDALSTILLECANEDFDYLLDNYELGSYPISIQAMVDGVAELYYIPYGDAGGTYSLYEIADIVDSYWDGETYIYLQFRFHDFPFTTATSMDFQTFIEQYYWVLSYPLSLDEYGILSDPNTSNPLQDIHIIDSSNESN